MKRRKIGPGVYAVGPLGEIEMDEWVIRHRRSRGLLTPPAPNHITKPAALFATPSYESCSGGEAAG